MHQFEPAPSVANIPAMPNTLKAEASGSVVARRNVAASLDWKDDGERRSAYFCTSHFHRAVVQLNDLLHKIEADAPSGNSRRSPGAEVTLKQPG